MPIRIVGSADFKRALFAALSAEIARQFTAKRITEKVVLQDFQRWRKARRKSRIAADTRP